MSNSSHTTNSTIAKTEIAVSRISILNVASGMRLLRGCVRRMRASTEDRAVVFLWVAARASVGIAVTGFCVCSGESGEFIGLWLSDIIWNQGRNFDTKTAPTPGIGCAGVGALISPA